MTTYTKELLEVMKQRQLLELLARKYSDSGNPELQFVARCINRALEPLYEAEMYLDGE